MVDSQTLKRRWFQFSLLALLVFVTLRAIPCSWIEVKKRQAARQRKAVTLIETLGGDVHEDTRNMSTWMRTLHGLLPDIFFEEIHYVEFKPKNNGVSDADLDIIVKLLPRTDILILPSTKVTDNGLATLNGLDELGYLSLNNTKVTDEGLEHLSGLKQLWALSVEGDEISDVGLGHLGNLKLRMLRLSATLVTDAGMARINCRELRLLALSDTKITDASLKLLEEQHELQWLLLNATKITDVGIASLRGNIGLRRLEICKTSISDFGLANIRGLHGLIDLLLNGTRITDAGLVNLEGMNELRNLELNDTSVTDAGLENLAGMKLDRLSLLRTHVTRAGVKNFQQRVPDCQISY
jgi:hypothetical protein